MKRFAVAVILMLGAHPAASQAPPPRRPAVVRDSTPADSVHRRTALRLPVTADVERTAFRDDAARRLLLRARTARMAQDSAVTSYVAAVRERLTARLGIGERGPARVLYRQESVSRVEWSAAVGARIQVTGARVGIPVAERSDELDALRSDLAQGQMSPVPYYPGQEAMWLGGRTVRSDVDDRSFVEPLADGSEAYYTFASGDSMTWTLPDGHTVHLRELTVRPRSPRWNLAVGSLWFDVGSAQLVRAAYRLAAPIDEWQRESDRHRDEGIPGNPVLQRVGRAVVSPFRTEISAITVEYGLFDGRFWLPRARSLEGSEQVSFARLPVVLEQAFSYEKINQPVSAEPIVVTVHDPGPGGSPDTLYGAALQRWRDSANAAGAARKAVDDSLVKTPCDSTGQRVVARRRGTFAVAVSYPCDVTKLESSPDFDHGLYDANDALFGAADRDALLSQSLPFGAQALLTLSQLPPPSVQYGLSMTRYNRIEGFSTGARLEQQIGAGYDVSALARFGFADHEPNGELSLTRTNLTRSLSFTGYNRLVSAGDWGSPLSFGSSVSAFLFGRDEGFYYRASGAELRWTTDAGAPLDWRLFGEEQRAARPHTDFSLGAPFIPNIDAARGPSFGGSLRFEQSFGLDPRGFRAFTDLRAEAATGDSSYGRAALDLTLSQGLPARLAASLTLAGGTSAGQLPVQRRWFLGGAETVRGQAPDTAQSGSAFWLTRLELGPGRGAYKIMLFGDLGWAGDRPRLGQVGRPLSGVGIGTSMLDGLVRFDVARGIYPRGAVRLSAYLQGRF